MHSYDSDGPSTVYLHFLSVRLREKKKKISYCTAETSQPIKRFCTLYRQLQYH